VEIAIQPIVDPYSILVFLQFISQFWLAPRSPNKVGACCLIVLLELLAVHKFLNFALVEMGSPLYDRSHGIVVVALTNIKSVKLGVLRLEVLVF
jgi:hypothetical protein